MYLGREKELNKLSALYKQENSSLIAIYGRRRIGKSSLLYQFSKDKCSFLFEGLENQETQAQIEHFKESLFQFTGKKIVYSINFQNWTQVFNYLTEVIEEKLKNRGKKIVLIFDEFQWMAVNQTRLVSLIKNFWDLKWKKLKVQLILCGSIASFMVEKVIKSKALYGRIDEELLISELAPFEIRKFFKKERALEEILQYLIILGGIPKYYEVINRSASFEKNIGTQFFQKSKYLFNEYEKIFYNQFKEHRVYEEIVSFLAKGPKSLKEIAEHLKMESGGGLKRYLTNLELARFINSQVSIEKSKSRTIKYTIFDEYLNFYFKYVLGNREKVKKDLPRDIFQTEVKPRWQPWFGLAFEKFCIKNINTIIKALELENLVDDYGPLFKKDDQAFQVDLIIKRIDRVWNVCECKYYNKPIGVEIVREFEEKLEKVKKVLPKGFSIEKTLIAPNGIDESMKRLRYFDSVVEIEGLFKG